MKYTTFKKTSLSAFALLFSLSASSGGGGGGGGGDGLPPPDTCNNNCGYEIGPNPEVSPRITPNKQ
jgi:hypothetical protein